MSRGCWAVLLLLLACGRSQARVDTALERMIEQPRYDSYERSGFFPNGAVMQPPPDGTMPRDAVVDPRLDPPVGRIVDEVPLPLTRELLSTGGDRFGIFCAVCHGAGGYGGSVVAANMVESRPPSLRRAGMVRLPAGYVYGVITNGFGRMPSYAAELSVRERWAVAAYLQDLQRHGAVTAPERADSLAAASLRAADSARTARSGS